MSNEKKNTSKHRFYEIVQYEFNPKTGEDLHFNENNIVQGISHKSIKEWAWVCHDKDIFSEYDYDEGDCTKEQIGSPKSKHWHCVIDLQQNKLPLCKMAEWFGVPEGRVRIKKGQNAFNDCVEYYTHEREEEQEKGKYLYSDEEIHSNIDFRQRLIARAMNRLKSGKSELDQLEEWKLSLANGEKNIKQLEEENQLLFVNNLTELQKIRKYYIEVKKPMPKFKFNFYLTGDSDAGKSLASRQLARALAYQCFPELTDDRDIFFTVGEKNNRFDGYEGQPVIIWQECRAYTLLEMLNGRERVFEVFDPFPDDKSYNVKYGKIRLTNTFNIVNSVQPYEEFLDSLCGEYQKSDGTKAKAEMQQKTQSYKRFPFIMPISTDYLDFLINKGVYGMGSFFEFEHIARVQNKCRELEILYNEQNNILRKVNNKLFAIPVKKYNELKEKKLYLTEEDFDRMFEELGTPVKDNNISNLEMPCLNIIDNQLVTDSKTKEIKAQEKIYVSDDAEIYNKGLNPRTGKIEKYYIDKNGNEVKLFEDKRNGKYFYFEK